MLFNLSRRAPDGGEIEIWGDGQQTRSYCFVADCVEGIYRLMHSDFHDPLNLGQDRLVTINQLIDMVEAIAGKKPRRRYDLTKPQGVRGRNADLELMKKAFGWEPKFSLEEGLTITYRWIEAQLRLTSRLPLESPLGGQQSAAPAGR